MGAASFYNYQMTPLMPRWAVGAGVSFKLFNGLNREYKFSAAKSQVKQVEALNVKAQNDILTLIDKLYNEMTTYSVQLPSINTAHDFAVEYLRIKETAFKEGRRHHPMWSMHDSIWPKSRPNGYRPPTTTI